MKSAEGRNPVLVRIEHHRRAAVAEDFPGVAVEEPDAVITGDGRLEGVGAHRDGIVREAIRFGVVAGQVVVVGEPDVVAAVRLGVVHRSVRQFGQCLLHHFAGLRIEAVELGDVVDARPGAGPDTVLRIHAETTDRARGVLADHRIVPELRGLRVETRDAPVVVIGEPDLVEVVDDDAVGSAAHHRDFPPHDGVRLPVPLGQSAGAEQRHPEVALRIKHLCVAAERTVIAELPVVDLAGLWIEPAHRVPGVPDRPVRLVHRDAVAAAVALEGPGLTGARVEADDAAGGIGEPDVALPVEVHLVRPGKDVVLALGLTVVVFDEHGALERLQVERRDTVELHGPRLRSLAEIRGEVVDQGLTIGGRQQPRIEHGGLAGSAEGRTLVHAVHRCRPGFAVFRRAPARVVPCRVVGDEVHGMTGVAGALEDHASGTGRIDLVVGQDLRIRKFRIAVVGHPTDIVRDCRHRSEREIGLHDSAGSHRPLERLRREALQLAHGRPDRDGVLARQYLRGAELPVDDIDRVGDVPLCIVREDDREGIGLRAAHAAGQFTQPGRCSGVHEAGKTPGHHAQRDAQPGRSPDGTTMHRVRSGHRRTNGFATSPPL